MARERRSGFERARIETGRFINRNIIKPATKWTFNRRKRYTRRDMLLMGLGGMLTGAAALEGGKRAWNRDWPFNKDDETRRLPVVPRTAPKPEAPKPEIARPEAAPKPSNYLEAAYPKMPEQVNLLPSSKPFFDEEANKEAEDLGLHAGDFIDYDGNSHNRKLTAFSGEKELLPIFPPSVLQHKDLLYKLSDEHGVPVNVIATIMTMESAGQDKVASNVGAQGLFGVMPHHFEAPERRIPESQWKDPETNGKVAMEVFNEILERTKREHKGKTEVYIYHRALMGYNGGTDAMDDRLPDEGEKNWANWESLIYGDNAMRFALTAQVASRLRAKGFTDVQIASRLSSYEMDARGQGMAAFYRYFNTEIDKIRTEARASGERTTDPKYRGRVVQLTKEYIETKAALGQKEVPQDQTEYHNYLKKTQPGFQRSPGMEVWAVTNGGLNFDQPTNKDEQAWKSINTKRSGSAAPAPAPAPKPEAPKPESKPGVENDNKPKVTLMSQLGEEWKGDPNWVPGATCGPTTLAMILKAFGEDADPAKVDKIFNAKDIRKGINGTVMRTGSQPGQEGGVLGWLRERTQYDVKKKKYDVQMIHDKDRSNIPTFDYEKAKKLTDSGHLIIASGNVNWIPWAGRDADHIFGISEVDVEKKRFKVFDPGTGKELWIDDRGDDMSRFHYTYAVKPEERTALNGNDQLPLAA